MRQRIAYGPSHSQAGDLWRPAGVAGASPVVVLIHGGFWRAPYTKGLMNRLARAVVARGWAAWNIEYRRVGLLGGGGGWPETFADVADAVDHVASLPGVDTDRVVACGHSAGGTLALWAAGRAGLGDGAPGRSVKVSVRGAVSLAGVADLASAATSDVGGEAVARLLGGRGPQMADRLALVSPSAMVPLGVPQVLIHGLQDKVVSPAMSERYVERACAAGDDARYVPLPGVGHREVIDPRNPAWSRAAEALEVLFGG
ncbi:MAG: alpha/beta hydrolase family protein [Acidimicrobiales bacterium]